jgi:hypothetical protein
MYFFKTFISKEIKNNVVMFMLGNLKVLFDLFLLIYHKI